MISPSDYDRLCDQLTVLYDDLDNAIIADITRRILKTGKITESAKWQLKQLQESGMLYDDILAEIASHTDATKNHVRTLFEDAGVQSIRNDNRFYHAAGLEGIVKMSDAALQTLNAGYLKCNGDLQNLTMTTAVTSQQAYITACNNAYMQVTSGAFDYNTAIRNAIKSAAVEGTHVLYPSGHRDRIDVAVRRSVLTGVGQTVRKLSEINANDMGCDLMEITAHSGARPSHAVWQGKLVSLSGKNAGKIINGCRVLSLGEIGYGSGDGFGGWNCRHDWYPFFEGISERAYTDKRLKELDARNIEYNGRKYTEYEISQIQRRYEREIRAAKREQTAFRTAVEEAYDPELKQVMQDSLNYANDVVRDKQAKMRDFINQTGQFRDYSREQNYGRVTYLKNSGKTLTSVANSGKIETERAISFKKVDKAIEYAKNKLSVSADSLSVLPVEKVNVILSHISRLYAKMPVLNGFVDEIVLEKMSEIAKASIKWSNGSPLVRLKLSSSIFSNRSIDEIESFIADAVKNKELSPKEGLYGVLKHEFAHMAEYSYTLKRYNYSQADVSKSLDNFEFAKQVKELSLKNCGLEDSELVITNYLSTYAIESPAEFIAEAYSSTDDNKLVSEVKRILKRKWGI